MLILVVKGGDWEEYKSIFKVEARATEWAFERIREAFEKVAEEEARRLSTVKRIMLKSTDYLAAHHCASRRARRCHDVISVPKLQQLSPENYVWWVSAGKKHSSWWCAICGENYDWRAPYRLLVVQTGNSASQAKVLKAHAVPQGLCENLNQCAQTTGQPAKRWRSSSPRHRSKTVKERKELWRA